MDNRVYKYSVKEANEDVMQTRILKQGMDAEFTLEDIRRDILYLKKHRSEIGAMIGVEKAKMQNILRDRPEVATIPRELMQIYFIYTKAEAATTVGEDKLREIDEQLQEYEFELAQISTQTGIEVPVPEDVDKKVGELLSENGVNNEQNNAHGGESGGGGESTATPEVGSTTGGEVSGAESTGNTEAGPMGSGDLPA